MYIKRKLLLEKVKRTELTVEIKRYTHDYVEDLLVLHNEVFSPKVTRDYLLQKYAVEKMGMKNICSIAYHANKPVAFYGVWPFPALFKGKQLWGVCQGDSITSPAYRGQGLFKKLAQYSAEIMKQDGLSFVFGFHSEQSLRAMKKLQWQELGYMSRFHLSTGLLGLNKIFEKFSFSHNLYQRYVETILSTYLVDKNLFWNRLNEEGLSINYNTAFLRYKSFTPNHVVKLEDCLVWLKVSGTLCVGATNGLTKKNVSKVLSMLKILGRKLMVSEIMFHISKNTREQELLSSVLTEKESWLIAYLPFEDFLENETIKLNYADIDTF